MFPRIAAIKGSEVSTEIESGIHLTLFCKFSDDYLSPQKKVFGTLSLTMAKVGTISGHSVDTGHFLSVTNVEMEIDVRCGL